jgi:hypothetical protein
VRSAIEGNAGSTAKDRPPCEIQSDRNQAKNSHKIALFGSGVASSWLRWMWNFGCGWDPPGSPNKLTVRRVEEVVRSGKRPPAENLRVIADRAMAMAAYYQPELTDPETKERRVNPKHDASLRRGATFLK